MNKCKTCVHKNTKDKPWYSTEPHPCWNCKHKNEEPNDNYTPKEA